MVSKSDNPADPFKKALSEATKVLADNPELSINYSVDPSGLSGDTIRLPQVSRRMTKDEVLLARGTADGEVIVNIEPGVARRVRIERIHMEQDAGKSIHDMDPDMSPVIDL